MLRRAIQLLAVPVGLVLTILGILGWQLREDVIRLRDQLDGEVDRAQAQVDSLEALQNELRLFVNHQRDFLDQQLTTSGEHLDNLIQQARRLGETRAQVENTREQVRALHTEAQQVRTQASQLTAEVQSGLDHLSAGRDEIRQAREEIQDTRTLVERRVFGRWSFVVHERREKSLEPVPLRVSMGIIKDGILEDFEVRSSGEIVHEAVNLPENDHLCAESLNGEWYRLTPSYIVELFWGDDIAGLEVERIGGPAQCQEGRGL